MSALWPWSLRVALIALSTLVLSAMPAFANSPRLQVQQPLGDAHLAAQSPNGRLVASVHFQGGVTLWDAKSRVILRTWRLAEKHPKGVCFVGNEKLFADLDGKFSVSDARTGEEVPFPLAGYSAPRATCLPDSRILFADTRLEGAGAVVLRFHAVGADMLPTALGADRLWGHSVMVGRVISVSPGAGDWLAIPVFDISSGQAEVLVYARDGWRRMDRVLQQKRKELPLTTSVAISRDGRHVLMAEAAADNAGNIAYSIMHVDRQLRRETSLSGLPPGQLLHIQALNERQFIIGFSEEAVVWNALSGQIERRWPGRSVPLTGAASESVASAGAGWLRVAPWSDIEKAPAFRGAAARVEGGFVKSAALSVGTVDRLRSFRFPEMDSATFDVSGPLREGIALKSLSDDGRRSIWSLPEDEVPKRCGATPQEFAMLPNSSYSLVFTTEHCFAVRDASGQESLVRLPPGEILAGVDFTEGGQIAYATAEFSSLKRAAVAAQAALAAAEKAKRLLSPPDYSGFENAALNVHARHHFYVRDERGVSRRIASMVGELSALTYLADRKQLAWLGGGTVRTLGFDGKPGSLPLPKSDRIERFQVDGTYAYVVTRDAVPEESRNSAFADALRPYRLTIFELASGRTVATRSPWTGFGELLALPAERQVITRDSGGKMFKWEWSRRTGHDRSMPRIDSYDEIRQQQASWVIVDRLGTDTRFRALWDVAKDDWWRPAPAAREFCAEPLEVGPAGDSVLCRRNKDPSKLEHEFAVIDLASGASRFTFTGQSRLVTKGLPKFLPKGEIVNIVENAAGVRMLQIVDPKSGQRRDLIDTGDVCGFCKFFVIQDEQGRLGVLREWIAPRFRQQTEFVVFSGSQLQRVGSAALPLKVTETVVTDSGMLVLGFNPRSAAEAAVHELGELDLAAGTWRSIGVREGDEWSPPAAVSRGLHSIPGTRSALLLGRPAGATRTQRVVAHRVDLDTGEVASVDLADGVDISGEGIAFARDGRFFAVRNGRGMQKLATIYSLDPLKRVGEVPVASSSTRLGWTTDGMFAAFSPGEGVIEYEPATLAVRTTHRDLLLQQVKHVLAPNGHVYRASRVEGRPEFRRADAADSLTYFAEGLPAADEVIGAVMQGQFAITKNEDGGLAIWNVKTLAWVARIFLSANGEWVVVDPEGRFDTSDIRGFNLARWSRADRPFESLSPEVFMREYFEPRLLTRLLSGERFRPVRPLATLNLNQPQVTIRSATRTAAGRADVEVTVISADGTPVHDLRLFREGQLVASAPDQGGALKQDGATSPAVFRFSDIALPTGRNVEFSAYAFNADGVRSEYSRIQLEQPAASTPTRRAFVVSIGVNRTENPDFDLDFAAADARRLNASLVQRLTRSGRFAHIHGATAISDDTDRRGATKANIRKALAALARGSADAPGPDDLVVLTFSGHGLVDIQGSFHLMPHDTGPGRGKGVGLLPEDLKRMIASDELALWLRDIDAGEFVFIVDACHSAATVESPDFKPGPMASRGLGQMAFDKGMRILAATQANDVALEAQATQQGLLSYALVAEGLDAFRADFKPQDRRILMDEWLAFAVERVPTLTREIRTGQFKGGVGGAAPVRPRNAQPLPARIPLQRPSLFDFRQQRGELLLQQRNAVN